MTSKIRNHILEPNFVSVLFHKSALIFEGSLGDHHYMAVPHIWGPCDHTSLPLLDHVTTLDACHPTLLFTSFRTTLPYCMRYVIRKEAWPFYRTISGARLCWELEKPKGPKGRTLRNATNMLTPALQGYLAHEKQGLPRVLQ